MAMDRLEAMRLYTRIVELGSFTAAADDLNLPRATVTHAIKRLEARLGAQLLLRTTRRVRSTRDGQTYYGHCVRLQRGAMESATVFNADPAAQAKAFTDAGFEWLHCVDLNGAFDGRSTNADAIKAIRAAIRPKKSTSRRAHSFRKGGDHWYEPCCKVPLT